MAYRSPTSVDLVSNATGLFYWLAEVTNFWFYRMLLISLGVIIFWGFFRSTNEEDPIGAFAVSTFIVWGLATMIAPINLLTGIDWGVATGLFVVAIMILLIFGD